MTDHRPDETVDTAFVEPSIPPLSKRSLLLCPLSENSTVNTTTIAAVDTFAVTYPVTGFFKFFRSRDGTDAGRETVVVRVRDESGHIGWGQCVPSPSWSYETLESIKTTIDRYLGPALIGRDPFDAAAIETLLERTIAPSFSIGQPLCKAGIDLALFDLTGRISGQTAHQRWGREGCRSVTLSWTLNPQAIDELPELVEQAGQRGYRHFNIKVAPQASFDLEVCRQLRRLAPQAFLWVDANGGYDERTALEIAPKLADLGIAAFEQPLSAGRLGGFRRLKQQGALPILMDEPIVSSVELAEFHQLGLLDGVAMKVSRCSGLSEARRIVEYLEQHGLLFYASGLTDPDLSLTASLLLFGAYGLEHPAALNGPQFLSGSLLTNPIEIVGDQATVPTGIGLGVDVDETALERLRFDPGV